jgi:hypothetical protein
MTEQQKQAEELTITDLALARAVIETATDRGTFKANELAQVGALYNKLDMFLKQVEEQAKAAKEGQEAAQAAATTPPPTAPTTEKEADNA